MVKFLDLPQQRTPGSRLMEGLGNVSQSIPDMIGTYQKKKSLDQLGSSLPEHQKKVWDSLDLGMQEKLAPGIFTSLQKRSGQSEKIPFGAAKYLKEFNPALAENPKAKQAIGDLARKYFDEGSSEIDSYRQAIEEYQGAKGQKASSESQGFFDKFLKGSSQSGREQTFGIPQEGEGQSLLESLTRERGSVDPVSGNPVQHKSVGQLTSEPSTLSGKQIFGSEALGAIAAPYEFALKERGKIDPVTGKPISPSSLLTERLREKLQADASPEQREQMEAAEFLGGLIPIESMVVGLAKIGKQAGFFKNAEKLAAKAGTTAEEAAQTILKQAQKEGIDLSKVAKGDRQESGKLFNLSNRVSREAPKNATELRMQRAKPAEKTFPTKERMATRETQLKEFPKYEAEIAQDALERAERAEKRVPKTVKGMQSQQIRAHEAQKMFPKVQEGYRKAIARVRALEDEAAKLTGTQRERLNALIEHSKSELRDAEFALKQGIENLRGESYRAGLSDMREAAQRKVLQISDDIAKGEPIKLAKMDYNPEMIAEGKRIGSRKQIPAVKSDDFYQQVHKEYGDVYRKRLEQVEGELKAKPASLSEVEHNANLKKEKDILHKLIDQTEAERTIHRHKLALRETAERHKAKERLGKFKETEAHPKVEKVAKEKIEQAIRNPSSKAAEEVASSAGVKKEDLKSAFDELKKKTEQITEKVAKNEPRSRLLREIDRFSKEIKEKNWSKAFLKTPIGQEILLTIAGVAVEEMLGKKIPYSSLATAAIGTRRGAQGIRAVLLFGYREIKNSVIKESYKKAIDEENDEKVAKIRREHPKLAKEASKELRI